jgi:hypothetical protein
MAIPGDTVWEVRTTGSDTDCGGGFSDASKGASGTDLTQNDAAVYTYTSDLSATGTTTLTSAGGNFTSDIQGNVIAITGQGYYCITGFTNSTTVTVDRALGTFATTTGFVGGALASPGLAAGKITTGNIVYVKSGTYNTSASSNVAGGNVNVDLVSSTWRGYGSTRNDGGTKPILKANANSQTVMTFSRGTTFLDNFEVQGTGRTTVTGITCGGFSGTALLWVYRCKVIDFDGIGIKDVSAGTLHVVGCEISGCTGTVGSGALNITQARGGSATGCYVHDNVVAGGVFSNITVKNCIFENNTGSTSVHGLNFNSQVGWIYECAAYGNAGHGFAGVGLCTVTNCIAEGQTGTTRAGFDNTNTNGLLINCAVYNNTISTSATGNNQFGTITGSGSFFTNAANGDFSLNNTVNAGALLRAAGYPGTYPGGLTISYPDIGAAQTQSTSATTKSPGIKTGGRL